MRDSPNISQRSSPIELVGIGKRIRHGITKDRGCLFKADFVLFEVKRGLDWIVIEFHAPLFRDTRMLRPDV